MVVVVVVIALIVRIVLAIEIVIEIEIIVLLGLLVSAYKYSASVLRFVSVSLRVTSKMRSRKPRSSQP
jgi:hypothetical protein